MIVAYACSGLGMGIASPSVVRRGAGRQGRGPGRPGDLDRSVDPSDRLGVGAAVAGIVFAASLSSHQVAASEHVGAYVPEVWGRPGSRTRRWRTVGLLGVIATRWLYDDRRTCSPVERQPDHVPV